MAHPARLSLRAPPHLPFIQGFPGIPGSPIRPSPAVCGTVEVRIGPVPIKAKWVRVEIRKHELLPAGFPSSSNGDTWEHVGEVVNLWQSPPGKEYGDLETADFKFHLPLPEAIPPSVDMLRGGIQYELVAALCYRNKGGLFKKESSNIMKISEHVRITKHELHSAWPLYNTPDSRTVADSPQSVQLTVQRPSSAFGPSDRILFTASLRSSRSQPFKLKGFECHLHEIITALPPPQPKDGTKSKKSKALTTPVSKSRAVASARCAVDESVGRGGEKSARMELAIPAEKLLMTVKNARMMEVGYELEVRAVCDGLPEVRMGGIKYVVGPFTRSGAQQAVRDIGHFDALCPGPPGGNVPSPGPPSRPDSSSPGLVPNQIQRLTPSPGLPNGAPSFPPGTQQWSPSFPAAQQQPIQGFIPRDDSRRKSSGTSVTTTTTTTTAPDFGPTANGRTFSTAPNRASVTFPSANPAGGLRRTASQAYSIDTSLQSPSLPVDSYPERMAHSELGHGEERSTRYSSGTTATFGRWDMGLKSAMEEEEGLNAVSASHPATPVTPVDRRSSHSPSPQPPFASSSASANRSPKPPPSAWPSAEQEKLRLYNQARNKAASTQQATGVPLDRLGLDDIPSIAPPEYAPPRPVKPAGEEYAPPSRSISEFVSSPSVDRVPSPIPDVGSSCAPPPPKKPTMPTAYLSATEEKELQRQRYEAAQRRVVSGAPSPSGHSSPRTSTSAIDSPTPGQSPSRTTGSPVPNGAVKGEPIPYEAIFPTVSSSSNSAAVPPLLDEKEQMRRYYEARDRVDRTARGEGSTGGQPDVGSLAPAMPQHGTTSHTGSTYAGGSSSIFKPSKGVNPEYMPAAEEKEMMRRRYDEATTRVAKTQVMAIPALTESPVVVGLSGSAPPASGSSSSGLGGGSGNIAPYMSAAEEKEMMRRRYEEASSRVARAHSSSASPIGSPNQAGPSAMSQPSPANSPPLFSTVPSSGSSFSPTPSGAYMSSAEEKEAMRKRYEEATSRVARMQGNEPTSSRPTSPLYSGLPGGPSPISPPPLSPTTQTGLTMGQDQSAVYKSAEQEKEAMRRYEEASASVSRARMGQGEGLGLGTVGKASSASGSGNGTGSSSGGSAMNGSTSSHTHAYPGSSRQSGESSKASSPPESPSAKTVGAAQGKARGISAAGSGGDAPPPLPARPPAEYINLLSPVQER